jgi:hypothetical protein
VWHLINIQLSKQSKMKKMTDLQKFLWDESDEVKTVNTTYTSRELEILNKIQTKCKDFLCIKEIFVTPFKQAIVMELLPGKDLSAVKIPQSQIRNPQ